AHLLNPLCLSRSLASCDTLRVPPLLPICPPLTCSPVTPFVPICDAASRAQFSHSRCQGSICAVGLFMVCAKSDLQPLQKCQQSMCTSIRLALELFVALVMLRPSFEYRLR